MISSSLACLRKGCSRQEQQRQQQQQQQYNLHTACSLCVANSDFHDNPL